jgi:hypothetical protein
MQQSATQLHHAEVVKEMLMSNGGLIAQTTRLVPRSILKPISTIK